MNIQNSGGAQDEEIFGRLEKFFIRNIKYDLAKDLGEMPEKKSDFMLFHMSNIRFGLLRDCSDRDIRLTSVTRWDKFFHYISNLAKNGFIPKKYEVLEVYELQENEFYGYIDGFMAMLLQRYKEEQLVLFEVYMTDDMVNARKDNLSKYQAYEWLPNDDWMRRVNEVILKAHTYIKEKWPRMHIVESPEPILAYEGHKWGKYPTHFMNEYYEYAYNAMNVIAEYGNKDRDAEQLKLNILKKKYDYVFYRCYANLKMGHVIDNFMDVDDFDLLARRLDKSMERWTWDRYLRIQDRLMPEIMKRLEVIERNLETSNTVEKY